MTEHLLLEGIYIKHGSQDGIKTKRIPIANDKYLCGIGCSGSNSDPFFRSVMGKQKIKDFGSLRISIKWYVGNGHSSITKYIKYKLLLLSVISNVFRF